MNRKKFGRNNKNQTFCKWEGINFPSQKDDWKKFEKNNVTIAHNILYAIYIYIYPDYVSKDIQIVKNRLFF